MQYIPVLSSFISGKFAQKDRTPESTCESNIHPAPVIPASSCESQHQESCMSSNVPSQSPETTKEPCPTTPITSQLSSSQHSVSSSSLCPNQPVINLPRDQNKRRFKSEWYKDFPWLEYTVEIDAAFCFACKHFGNMKG